MNRRLRPTEFLRRSRSRSNVCHSFLVMTVGSTSQRLVQQCDPTSHSPPAGHRWSRCGGGVGGNLYPPDFAVDGRGIRRGQRSTDQKPYPWPKAAQDPIVVADGENSRAKVQKVDEDSSALSGDTNAQVARKGDTLPHADVARNRSRYGTKALRRARRRLSKSSRMIDG